MPWRPHELYHGQRPSYSGAMPHRVAMLLLACAAIAACSDRVRYPLTGQVVAVDVQRQELTVRHQDIKGFMPGMTMPFKVRAAADLDSAKPGDLVTATLVVEDSTGYLEDVRKTGEAPLPPDAPTRPRLAMLDPGAEVPDTVLIDQEGKRRPLSAWRGKVLAVTFVYTRCPLPNFCPLMDQHYTAVQKALEADSGLSGRVHLLSVSFDPDHDTPEVLATHAARAGADPAIWSYVTGPRETIDAFAGGFGVAVMREDQPVQEIVHNLRTAVIGADGRLVTILNGNDWTPEQLLEALRAADARR